MSLVNCKECEKEVGEQTVRCPSCGARLKTNIVLKVFLIAILIVVTIFVLLYITFMVTPQYVTNANNNRSHCLEIVKAANSHLFTRENCQIKYEEEIERGKGIIKPIVPTPEFKEEKLKMQESLQASEIEYKNNCIERKEKIKKEYQAFAEKNEWYKAGLKVWRCAELTNDSEFKILGDRAKKKSN
jgi:hypothetical protein